MHEKGTRRWAWAPPLAPGGPPVWLCGREGGPFLVAPDRRRAGNTRATLLVGFLCAVSCPALAARPRKDSRRRPVVEQCGTHDDSLSGCLHGICPVRQPDRVGAAILCWPSGGRRFE